jgi:hypothetical protein
MVLRFVWKVVICAVYSTTAAICDGFLYWMVSQKLLLAGLFAAFAIALLGCGRNKRNNIKVR